MPHRGHLLRRGDPAARRPLPVMSARCGALGLVAAVVPLAVAGVGPREIALVGLLALVGVSRESALVLSLGYAAVLIALAGLGGLLQLFGGGFDLRDGAEVE